VQILGLTEEELMTRSEELRPELVPPPSDAADVCSMCRSWRNPQYRLCSNCLEASDELARPCTRVVPITLYRRPSRLRDWLTYYKQTPEVEHREEYRVNLATVLGRFMRENQPELWDTTGGYSVACVVPSSSRQELQHPLRGIVSESDVFGVPVVDLLRRGVGDLGHRILSDRGFVPNGDVSGERVLLVDDVYTTGSRAQSAASALQVAGGSVAAVLVLARRIDPDFNEAANQVWLRQSSRSYDFINALAWLRPSASRGQGDI
jgi:predicted amidophosphoribosyltransferase